MSWSEVLASSVVSEIAGACEEGGMQGDKQLEVARAVASLASRDHPVPSGYLILLLARALWSVGEENAARCLIERRIGDLDFAPACAAAAFLPDIQISRWWAVVSLRAVRPSSVFDSVRGGTWVLDLAGAVHPCRDGLELALFRLISVVLDDMAPLWDASGGRGILGLRHISSAAAALLKRPGASRKTRALIAEIMKTCSAKLQALRKARGWSNNPHVISLDWQR